MIAETETTATDRRLTPLKAIRKHCVEHCCLGQPSEVRVCPCKDCEFYPYRLGHKPKTGPPPKLSPLKAIRARCVDCSACELKRVKECPIRDCPTYEYRMGKNPALVEKRGKGNPDAIRRARQMRMLKAAG